MIRYAIVFDQRLARWEVVTFDPMQAEPEATAPEGDGQFNEFNPFHTRVSWFVDPAGVMHMSERGQGHGDMPEFQRLMQANFQRMQAGQNHDPVLAVGEFRNGNLQTHSSLYPQQELEPQIVELYNQRRAADHDLPEYSGMHNFTPNMDPKAVMPSEDKFWPEKVQVLGHDQMMDPADVDAVMNAAQVKPQIVDPTGQTWVWDPSSHTYTRTVQPHDTDRSHAWGGDADLFDPATQTEKAMNPLDEGIMAQSSEHPGPGIYNQMDVDPDDRPAWSATCPHCGGSERLYPSWHGPAPRGAVACRHCGQQVNLADFLPETHEQVPDVLPTNQDTPGQIDTLVKHAEVPSQYPAWGEPHCDNCKEGLPQWREDKPGEPRLCEKCQNNPAVLEDMRRQFRRSPPQHEHRDGPFPERVPKPNPYKQDNTFPSMPTTKSHAAEAVKSRSNTMPEFHHYAEEQAWREANGIAAGDASLDACPQCGDPSMVDDPTGHQKVCTNCGHKQPIHDLRHMQEQIDAPGGFAEQLYDSLLAPGLGPRQQSVHKVALCPPLLALAAPLVEGAAGVLGADTAGAAIGGAVRAGASALTDTGLKGFVARHAAGQAIGGAANDAGDAVGQFNPANADVAPPDNSAMYSSVLAADEDDDKGGGTGSGDEGHDDDPDAGNQGFEEEHGDSPDLLKNTDMLGPGQEGGYSEEQHEALAHLEGCGPLVVSFIMAPESGRDSPIISQVEKMLRTAFKGHQGFESKFAEHSGEGNPDNSEDSFEQSVDKLKDDPNGDADSSDHPADPNEAAEAEERRDDNESSKESATMVYSCRRCSTPVWEHQANCTRCGFAREAMLPGQVPPNSAMPAQAQGQPMPMAQDANSTACPVCGGVGGAHQPGCTAQPTAQPPQPIAPQPQQGAMGAYANVEAAAHADGCECSFPVCVRKREEAGTEHHEDESSEDEGMEHESAWYTADDHGHQNADVKTDHSSLFENTPDEPGAPAHDLTVNSNLWVDSGGQPLREGSNYLLKSPNYSIPDRITVEAVNGDKLKVLVHTRYLSYENTLTPKQVTAESLSFEPDAQGDTAEAGVGLDPSLEHNNDDNTVAESAGADQSDTYTPVSHITDEMKELYPQRNWLWDDVAPMDKTAGADYTPKEQRQFIEESGKARNLDRLELEGTHYVEAHNFDEQFNWGV